MTVWKIIRGVWTIVSLPFVAIATLNVERIAEAHRLDDIVPDPTQKLGWLATLAQQPWVIVLSVLIAGVTIGLWAKSVLRVVFSRRVPSRKDKLNLLGYEMHNMLRRANHFMNFTYIGQREYEGRLLNADLNVLITKTARMGIPPPKSDATMDEVEDYFARVGAWLIDGDIAGAIREATRD